MSQPLEVELGGPDNTLLKSGSPGEGWMDGCPLQLMKLTFSHLKMDGWNTSFLLGNPIFRGYVRFKEGTVDDQLMIYIHTTTMYLTS